LTIDPYADMIGHKGEVWFFTIGPLRIYFLFCDIAIINIITGTGGDVILPSKEKLIIFGNNEHN